MVTKLCWVKQETNEGGLIPCVFSAHSPGSSMVMFRYYLLGDDTAAPSGLYARLFHALLVLCIVFLLENSCIICYIFLLFFVLWVSLEHFLIS